MLLDVEVSVWVPATDGENVCEGHTQRIGEKLGDKSNDVDTGVAEGEELVDSSADKDEDLPSW